MQVQFSSIKSTDIKNWTFWKGQFEWDRSENNWETVNLWVRSNYPINLLDVDGLKLVMEIIYAN